MVVDALGFMTMGRVSYVDESQNDLVKDVHRMARLAVTLEDSLDGCFMVHHNSESSFVDEVKSKQNLDQPLMELKKSFPGKLDESFSLGQGEDEVLMYHRRLCVPNIDGLRNRIIEEAHGSHYSIHLGSTKMYHDLR